MSHPSSLVLTFAEFRMSDVTPNIMYMSLSSWYLQCHSQSFVFVISGFFINRYYSPLETLVNEVIKFTGN
jgi:hypothetical protein